MCDVLLLRGGVNIAKYGRVFFDDVLLEETTKQMP